MTVIANADLDRILTKKKSFDNSKLNAINSLNNYLAIGTDLYSDPLFAQIFSQDYANYLITAGPYISNFMASYPAEPAVAFNVTPAN